MIALRTTLLAAALAPLVLLVPAVQAAPLAGINQALQACLQGGKPRGCPAALQAIEVLQSSNAYEKADPLCKQQVVSFKDVVTLMALRDTTPIEAQGRFDAVAQVCASSGI